MSRWIDIDDDRNCFCGYDGVYEKWNIDPEVMEEAIVHCRECKWWADINGGVKAFGLGCCCYGGKAMRLGFLTAGDWFCGDGERKDK